MPLNTRLLFDYFKGACGTAFGALFAGSADGYGFWFVKLGLNNGCKSASDKSENALLCNLITYSHAKSAKNAFSLIALDNIKAVFDKTGMLLFAKSCGTYGIIVCIFN